MQIALLILLAVAMGIVVTMVADRDTYKTFSEAKDVPDGKLSTVVGELHDITAIEFDPEINPNLTTFFVKDKNEDIMKVKYFEPKPIDFERSEQVTITGKVVGDEFHAKEMLVKCPSKYVEEGVKEATAELK